MADLFSTTINIRYGSQDSTELKSMTIYASMDVNDKIYQPITTEFIQDGILLSTSHSDNIYIKDSANGFSNINLENSPVDSSCKRLRLWWPVEKCGTYIKKLNKYHVYVYTYDDIVYKDEDMNGTTIIFESNIIDMMDNLAGEPMMKFGVLYQEYSDIYIPDDFQSDKIFITITPINPENNTLAYSSCQAGSSVLSIAGDPIHLSQGITPESHSITYHIGNEPISISSLYDMLKEKYHADKCTVFIRTMVADVYKNELKSDHMTLLIPGRTTFPLSLPIPDIISPGIYEGEDGLEILSSLDVYFDDNTEIPMNDEHWRSTSLSFISNPIPVTSEIYKYIYTPEDIESLNDMNELISLTEDILNKITDMSKTVISIPNIIETHTIQVNQVSSGSGVIKPVFVHAYPLDSVVFHRDIKENIIINLDTYLGKTSMFYLKICGVFVPEYSRQYDGVVFNVDGSYITTTEGTYYICDEDKNLITTGKYTVE